jgi:putative restriction endonuclease
MEASGTNACLYLEGKWKISCGLKKEELEKLIEKYLIAFSKLKRGNTSLGIAPHKPLLLLSLIELIDKGFISKNAVPISGELVGIFKENWQLLVPTSHNEDFTQPFFYLQSDKVAGAPFWFLKAVQGYQINKPIKSVNTLAAVCAYGYFSEELFLLLTEKQVRLRFQTLLLDKYFLDCKAEYLDAKRKGEGYLHDQIIDVLNEPEARYKHVSIHTEEDIFVRSGLFKQLVPKLYDHQCSFTGMKLTSIYNYNFIDACHIVPFSHTNSDKITNGIALCPNLHRAFDRGLVGITDDYRIMVSPNIIEDNTHPYSISQLEGKSIILPKNEIHYPKVDGLIWHRENVFKDRK